MLSQLKQWFRSNTSRPAARRTAKIAGLRGQIELLEARTVLSASVGSISSAFEMGHASVREDSLATVSRRLEYPEKAIAVAHWEDAPMPGLASNGRTAQSATAGEKMPIAASWYPSLFDRPRVTVFVVTVFAPSSGYTTGRFSPPRMDPGYTAVPKAIAATSPYHSWQNELPYVPPQAPPVPADFLGSHAGLLAALSAANDNEPAAAAVVRSRNSVSHTDSDGSLLLATSIRDWNDSENDRTADEFWAKSDHEESDFVGLQELTLDGNNVSLEVLQQEREALDVVFSDLSDVPDSTRISTDDASSDFRDSKAITRDESYEEFLPANTADLPSVRHDIDEGGMVLLAPAGDANLHAYDFIETVAGSVLETNVAGSLGVEVSVGMYQALDVGAYEAQTSVNQGAVSAPSAASRPSAAAENTSGKNSTQPS
jgi:hypothetical protein